jgi:NAD(P)-dependent dehydrogenase (short-subunit alcohol dehydrogenase family)
MVAPSPAGASSPRRLAGRAALVTGGSRGIGRAIAVRLASDGADVAITVHHDPGEATLAACRAVGARAVTVAADLADPLAPARAVEVAHAAFGRLDILVNNAGGSPAQPFLDVAASEWDAVFALNTRGPFLAMQAAARVMLGQGGGTVVNVASVAAHGPRPSLAAYAAAKAALLSLTRSAAAALASRGIRVNAVCPGLIETDVWVRFREEPEGRAMFERRLAETVMGRAGTPDEVADAVAYLVSDEARYVTGQGLHVCGGLEMH